MFLTDTIAAIASGTTNAGISVIRISGPEAVLVVDRIFRCNGKFNVLSESKSHTIQYGFIYDGEDIVDEVIVLLMKAPRSYTKEDVVEIDCHGGVLPTKKILEVLIKNGARTADPGEFTKRAFLNGRIDLSKAEAVMELIEAKSTLALKNSVKQLRGGILNRIKSLRESILTDVAYIEAALDDPEHISLEGFQEKLEVHLQDNLKLLYQLYESADSGRILREGIKTVILGKPNAGKSTLLNTITGEDRAIVTDIEGTTRDLLEEQIKMKELQLNIIDTAGIRETDNIVEKIGVERAIAAANDADLIIYIVDVTKQLDENDRKIIDFIRDKKAIVLLNKIDKDIVVDEEELKRCIDKKMFYISAKEQKGIEQIENEIEAMFFQGEISFNDQVYITNIRHKEAIQKAIIALQQVVESVTLSMPEDFYSIDLMQAYEFLGSIVGEAVDEDLINTIFEKFCMGK